MSRRRLLFLGVASALGVAFARILDPVRKDTAAAPGSTDPHHGQGSPSPQDTGTTGPEVRGAKAGRWSDPATWGGKIPGPGDVATITTSVLMDIDPVVGSVVIASSGVLTFDPNATRTLTSKGNVIVRGLLVMRPSSASNVHKISITGSKPSLFKGGGAIPLSTDTGLWVTGDGVWDARGSAKRGWIRASGNIAKGTKSVTLKESPSGWRVGDEIVITPTGAPTAKNHYAAYDTATIRSISGSNLTLSKATGFAHPLVNVGRGKSFTAEVLNLTRNVRVEGLPNAHVHVFLNSRRKQTLRHLAVRHVGVRDGAKGVLGRYGLHFHMAGNASRGSLVEGAVVRDSGHHGFVPHASHGVTFRDCVAHNIVEEAYWWDPGPGNATLDAFYDRCVASQVSMYGNAFRLSGFWLGHGEGNRVRGSVAVGVLGAKNASGFGWPESPGPRTDGTVWGFDDCVAHNNKVDGIFVWQNNSGQSVIDGFVGYHNGKMGIEHGAYRNVYQYKNSILYGNGAGAASIWAVSGHVVPLSFSNVLFDGAGRNDYVVLCERHQAPPGRNTLVTGCTFKGYTQAAVGLVDKSAVNPDALDVVGCTFAGNEFWLESAIDAGTVVRVQDAQLGSIALRRKDQPGTYHPEWNASVSDIANFA